MVKKIIIAIFIYIFLIVTLKVSSLKWQSNLLVKSYKVLLLGFVFGIICALILSSLIISEVNSKIDDRIDHDYLLILGAGLNGDQVSTRLKIRLDTALELAKESDIQVIVSGGQGPNEDISEAEAMLRYLIDHGISEKRIIKEEASTSTQENIKFSDKLIQVNNPKIILVTSDYHMYRSKMLARRMGWYVSGQSGINTLNERMKRMFREVFALAKDIIIRTY